MLTTMKRQSGLTLIELLIGMLVGLVVLGAATAAFLTSSGAQTDNLNLARLNQDMRAMMDIMTRDIRRSGYVTSDPVTYGAQLRSNPFYAADKDVQVLESGSCITYSYNADSDAPPAVDDSEHFGFRLSNNGELEMRSSGTTNTSCTNGTWETITEPEIQITALSFTLNSNSLNVTSMVTDTDGNGVVDGDTGGAVADTGNDLCDINEVCNTCVTGQSCLYVRSVTISLSGQLRDDPTVRQTITQRIRLRNDKFIETLP